MKKEADRLRASANGIAYRSPLAKRYLTSLPQGLDSFPQLETRASIWRCALETLPPTPAALETLTRSEPRLAALFRAPPEATEWIPEVLSSVALLTLADLNGFDEARFIQWSRDVTGKLIARPVFRWRTWLSSPRSILKVTCSWWRSFRRGSALHIRESDEHSCVVELTIPSVAVSGPLLDATWSGLAVVLTAAGARAVFVDTHEPKGNSSTALLRWE